MTASANGPEISVVVSQSRDIFVRLSNFRDSLTSGQHVESAEFKYLMDKDARVRVYPTGDALNPGRVLIQLIFHHPYEGGLDQCVTGFLCEDRFFTVDNPAGEVRRTKNGEVQEKGGFSMWPFNHMATDNLDCSRDEILFVIRPHLTGDLEEVHEVGYSKLTWRIPKHQLAQAACGALTNKSQKTTNQLQFFLGNLHGDKSSGKITYRFEMPQQQFHYKKSQFGYVKPDRHLKVLDSRSWGGFHTDYTDHIQDNTDTSYLDALKHCEPGMSAQFVIELTSKTTQAQLKTPLECPEQFILALKQPTVTVVVDEVADAAYVHLLHFNSATDNQELSAPFTWHQKGLELVMVPAGSPGNTDSLELFIKQAQQEERESTATAGGKGWEGLQGFVVMYSPLTALEQPRYGCCHYIDVTDDSIVTRDNCLMQCWPVKRKHMNTAVNFEEFVIRPVSRLSVAKGDEELAGVDKEAPFLATKQSEPEKNLIYTLRIDRHILPMLADSMIKLLGGESVDENKVSFGLESQKGTLYLTASNIPKAFNGDITVEYYRSSSQGSVRQWHSLVQQSLGRSQRSARVKLCSQSEMISLAEGAKISIKVALGASGTQ
ncbi:hypothetical protein [Spongorhabdus nitratireducens]